MTWLKTQSERWRFTPIAIFATAVLLVLAGFGLILQNESSYRELKQQESRVQADILAASVAAALDFQDAAAVQEAVDAFRVNPQIRWIGVYDSGGRLIASYNQAGAPGPAMIAAIPEPADGTIRNSVPVTTAGQHVGTVYFDLEREPLSRRLTRYAMMAFLAILAALVVATLGIAQLALRRANRELVAANAELKVQMEERAKAEDQLRQAQKMQALGQLTGGIAHDFNNLLTVIQGSADMLCREKVSEEKRQRFARAIVQAAGNAAALTSQLLAFARRQPLKPEAIDLDRLIGGMRDLLDRTLGERIQVRSDLSAIDCHVRADRGQLESAILNVAVNARDAMAEGGCLTIRTALETGGETPMIALTMTDTGTGMDEETLSRVFEPFFTTKATGRGTGLGLSQVYGFASQSGGEVRAESRFGEGTSITLLLPCAEGAVDPRADGGPEEPAAQQPATILVVEDNEEVAAFAQDLLAELGHRTVLARSGEEGLDCARRERFDVVLSDVVMPGLSGIELADILRAEQPALPIVLTTGYSQQISTSGSGGRPVIAKPYRLETLAAAILEARRGTPPQAVPDQTVAGPA